MKETTDRLWTFIRQLKLGDAIWHDPVVHKDSGDLWCRSYVLRVRSGQFRIAVCYHNEESITGPHIRQKTQNVLATNYRWPLGEKSWR